MLRRTFIALMAAMPRLFAAPKKDEEMKPDVLFVEDADEKILEEFSINAATWNLLQATDGNWEFTLKVTTDKALKRSKERESLFNNLPYFEATAILTAEEAFVAQGKIITQKVSFDKKRKFNLSWFYYSGGGNLEDLRIEILNEKEGFIDIKLNGINDRLDSKVALRTKLKKDVSLKRSVE